MLWKEKFNVPAPVISHNWPGGVKSVEPTLKQLVGLRILTYESLEEPSRVAEQNLMRSAWRSGPRVMQTHSRNVALPMENAAMHYWCLQVESTSWHTQSGWLQKPMTDVQTHMHLLLLFIRWGFVFTSYAQQIQRQTSSKPQTKFLHHLSCFPFQNGPHPRKSNPLRLSSSFTFWQIFYSNLILAERRKPCSEYQVFDKYPLPL